MPAADFIALFTAPLEQLGVPYMITGATAAILYGQPRLTNDLDVVIELQDHDIERLRAAFPEEEFYAPPADVIGLELARNERGHFNLIHHDTGFKADLYPIGTDPLHHWALPLRRRIPFGNASIAVAPPEYVIVRKLEYFREGGSDKHLIDIRAILAISGDQLDRAALVSWIDRKGLAVEWRRASH